MKNDNNDFNEHFNQMYKPINRGVKIGLTVFVFWLLFYASIVGGLIYVIFHFLNKIW